MSNYLFVFIDSFPFEILEEAKFLHSAFSKALPMTPGLGYSINIHAEIFCGTQPDDIGYYNEWTYDSGSTSDSYMPWLRSLCDSRGRLPSTTLDRILHKIFARFGLANANIPFIYRHLFARKEMASISQGDKFMSNTVFSLLGNRITYYISEVVKRPKGQRDIVAFEQAIQNTKKGRSLFVSFVDLDSLGHFYGVGSKEYLDRIKKVDDWTRKLCDRFIDKGGKSENIFVFSDHGMSNVGGGISVFPEKALGCLESKTYAYFTDSTIMRVWVRSNSLRSKAENYLNNLECGKLLSSKERKKYGILDPQFGDFIFLIDEGLVFEPSFVNRGGLPKAMHGYDPMHINQKGIFLTNYSSPRLLSEEGPTSIDVYTIFKEAIQKKVI